MKQNEQDEKCVFWSFYSERCEESFDWFHLQVYFHLSSRKIHLSGRVEEFLFCVFGSKRSDSHRLNKNAEFKENSVKDLKFCCFKFLNAGE